MMESNSEGPGLLDDVQEAAPFDIDAMIDDAASTPKQQYENAYVDPDIPEPGEEQGAEGEGNVSAAARRATAKAIMLMLDRGQAGVFTLFGAKGHSEDFRFNAEDRREMSVYLEEGLPANFRLPWYVPFSILFFTQIGVNVAKLQEVRAAKKQEEEVIARAKREQQRQEEEERAKVQQAYERKREAREAQALKEEREEVRREELKMEKRLRAQLEAEQSAKPKATRKGTDGAKPARTPADRREYMKAYNAKRRAERAAKAVDAEVVEQ